MANEGSIRMTTAQLRAMIAGGATREDLPTKANGGSVISTRDSASIAYLEAVNRARITAEFRARQQITSRQEAQQRTVQLELERTTANAIANADIQKDRVSIVNSTNINPVTTKYLDQFSDRGSIAPIYFDPSIYVVHGVQQDNNTPIVQTPIVNYSGIGKYQVTEVSKPSNSTKTIQNNKNNANETPVNQANLIPNANFEPVNTTELNKFATPDGVAPIVPEETNYKNIAIVGAAAAVLTGMVLIGTKR